MEIWIELKGMKKASLHVFIHSWPLNSVSLNGPGPLMQEFFFFSSRKHYITAWTLHQSLDGWRPRMQRNLGTEGQV